MNFNGKVVLITGGSSGIGADAACRFAKLGANVAIVGRNEKRLNEVADRIIEAGSSKPLKIVADVTKDAARIINETIDHFKQIDVLVNSAGIFGPSSIINIDIGEYDRMMDINLRSVIILTNLAVPHLEKTKGNVVNLSSIMSIKSFGDFTSYCISKAGLNQFTKCAALALASKGIRINAINPAMVRTSMSDAVADSLSKDREAFYKEHNSDYLVGRVGEVSDTTSAIVYLASESFVNGILLPIDGGYSCK